jgi:hypothetical protein
MRKSQASLAGRLWILASVFVVLFVEGAWLGGWLLLGAAIGLVWMKLPEEPEAPVERLPFQDKYEGRQIPRPPERD